MNDAVIRAAIPGDLSYIFSSMLRDLRDADGSALEDEFWFPAHRSHLERVLADPEVQVKVVVPGDDPNEILAYCIARPGQEIIWCHVRKGPLRKRGLAKWLLTEMDALDVPARWMTPLGRQRLLNPWRGRALRPRPSSDRPRSPAPSSGTRRASSASSPVPRYPAAPST